MSERLIQRVAELMREQAVTYGRLGSICDRLSSALVRGEVDQIESLTRSGEAELLSLRSRLAQITSALSNFANLRNGSDRPAIGEEARAAFESASSALMTAAREFQRIQPRAAALAINGVVFAGACIEMCGVKPTTYAGPYVRRGEGRPWA